jgi:hypothetical protein
VRYSTASLAFAALLLASLAAKVALSAPTPDPDPASFGREAAAMLARQGFATAPELRPLGMLVHARRRDCRLMLGDYSPYGTFADVIAARAGAVGPLRYVYRGAFYESAPKLLPLTDFYWWREQRRLGLAAPRHPVVAVAASPQCRLDWFDWSRLAALPH